jgi:hypothetical protein
VLLWSVCYARSLREKVASAVVVSGRVELLLNSTLSLWRYRYCENNELKRLSAKAAAKWGIDPAPWKILPLVKVVVCCGRAVVHILPPRAKKTSEIEPSMQVRVTRMSGKFSALAKSS